ncbi:hypothetical protein JW998_09050 [candidate division KSB1 bacterium]|nr:hypothetical protein [candidate division KSB1 bacterium]
MKQFYRRMYTFFFLLSPLLFGQAVNMPLEHWGYKFLARMEAKGLFNSYELRARPIPRDRCADIVAHIYERAFRDPELLSGTDWQLLEQLMGDLSDEFARDNFPAKMRGEKHLFRVQEPVGLFYGDLVGSQSIIANRGEQYDPDQLLSETTLGGQLRGHLGNIVGFFAEARNAMTRGEDRADESFNPDEGSPVVTSGANVFRDRATAYFVWDKPWLRLEAGRDEFDWGPGYHGGTTLTRNAPPADNVRFSVRFKMIKFSYMHAWLRTGLGAKYLAAHRLDISLFRSLHLGLSETVIYGDRNVELSYLNPLMLYHVAEHHLGDKDNNNLAFDLTCTHIPNMTLYGEWFIDDMTSTKIGSNYYGNKFAWLFGANWSDPLKLRNCDLKAEFSCALPYVYTHWDSINIYTHYDKIIGHWLGPNAASFYLEFGWQLSRDFRLELNAEHIRKGEGEANTSTRPAEGDRQDFLHGVVETRHLFGLQMVDQIRRDIFLALSYTYRDTRNLHQQQGLTSIDHLGRFHLYFNW